MAGKTQLCQNESTMGRASNREGAPSSNDTAIFSVGAMRRSAATPAHVISLSKIRCLSVNCGLADSRTVGSVGVVAALTESIVTFVSNFLANPLHPVCKSASTFLWQVPPGNRTLLLVHKNVFLSLGSNVGDRMSNLETAIDRLKTLGKVVAVSSIYESEPVEFTAQSWFLNCALKLDTEKMPRQLLSAVLRIEQGMGRKRQQKKGPRIIDIDILFFGNSIVDDKDLTIPHPAMHERRFVLDPMAEIAPAARHPILKKTVRELLDDLEPGQAVKKLTTK